MNADWEGQIWRRANGRCEYCLLPSGYSLSPFQIDHIIATKHDGRTELGNLALSCLACNSYKGPNIAGIDSMTGQVIRLYDPRSDRWSEHFAMVANGRIEGTTSIGRATVRVLKMNLLESVALRHTLLVEGLMTKAAE